MTDNEKLKRVKDFVLQRLKTTQVRAKSSKASNSKKQELINLVRAESFYQVLKYIENIEDK